MDMRSFIGDRISAYRKDVDRRFEVVRAANDDSPVDLAFDFDALAADTEFVNLLSHIAHNANVLKTMAESHHADTVALKAALEEIHGIASLEPRP